MIAEGLGRSRIDQQDLKLGSVLLTVANDPGSVAHDLGSTPVGLDDP